MDLASLSVFSTRDSRFPSFVSGISRFHFFDCIVQCALKFGIPLGIRYICAVNDPDHEKDIISGGGAALCGGGGDIGGGRALSRAFDESFGGTLGDDNVDGGTLSRTLDESLDGTLGNALVVTLGD